MKDYFGRRCRVGNLVAYGKSSRYTPMKVGIIQEVAEDSIKVLGQGNTKVGEISWYQHEYPEGNPRVVILPEQYKEMLK